MSYAPTRPHPATAAPAITLLHILLAGLMVLMMLRGTTVQAAPGNQTTAAPTAIVFVESNVQDYPSLLSNLAPGTEVQVLDAAQDGLTQMARVLRGRRDLDAIHVVSHGAPGALQLGALTLDRENLVPRGEELATLGAALKPQGSVLFYGCEVAAGTEGKAFAQALAASVGSNVAASTTLTGARALGGDWQLEFVANNQAVAVGKLAQVFGQASDRYGHVLTSIAATVNANFDTYTVWTSPVAPSNGTALAASWPDTVSGFTFAYIDGGSSKIYGANGTGYGDNTPALSLNGNSSQVETLTITNTSGKTFKFTSLFIDTTDPNSTTNKWGHGIWTVDGYLDGTKIGSQFIDTGTNNDPAAGIVTTVTLSANDKLNYVDTVVISSQSNGFNGVILDNFVFDPVPQPVVTSINPTTGSAAGGTSVTLTGTDLLHGTVKFGANSATVNSTTSTSISASSPAGSGTVHVTVTTDGGTSSTSSADQFSYGTPQSISYTSSAPGAATVGGATYTPTATATSGLTVTLTVDGTASSVCTMSGGVVSFIGVGTCVIDANQAGDATYAPATQVQQSFSVGKGSQSVSFTSSAPGAATVGGSTYTVTASATSGLTPTLTVDASAGSVCSISGSTVSFIGAGTCVLDANQAGNANYNAAPQVQQSFTVGKGSQTVSFTSSAPGAATVGGSTYTVTASATSGLSPTLTVDASASAVCAISGSTVSFIGVGTCTLNANQAGSTSYNAAPQVQQSFTVGKGSQTVSFTSSAPGAATVGGSTYTVTATATSGLTPALTVDASSSAVCSLSGSTVSFIGVGTCTLDANQAGNTNYNAAPQVQQSFVVGKGNQTVSFTSTAPGSASMGGATYTVTGSATSGLTPTITVDASSSAICSLSGSTVSFIGVGTCTLDANQAGNTNYNAAPQVQQSFTVGKATQTVSFTSSAPGAATLGGSTYTVTASATSGLTPTLTVDASASSVCTISGSTVSFIGVGTCVLDANQAGNASYSAAPQVQQSFTVGKGSQTVSFTSSAPGAAAVGGSTYAVTASATSGLTPTLTVDASATSVCAISGSTVSFIGAGTCVLNANQAGNTSYNAAPQVQQSFTVGKGNQTVSFTSSAPGAAVVGGSTYAVTASATSGLTPTLTVDASSAAVCTLSGATVSFIGIGTCTLNANQAGNTSYNAAPQVQQSFVVGKGSQTVSFTSSAPGAAAVGGATYAVTATATSGLTPTLTVDASASAVCALSGATVSFIGIGTCTLNVNQAGNVNYNAAPQVQQSFLVGKGSQTLSFTSTAPSFAMVGGSTYTVTATSTAGLTPTITVDASATSVCALSGSTVSFTATGTCVLNANQAGDATYNAAAQVQQSFTVSPPATKTYTGSLPGGGNGSVVINGGGSACGFNSAAFVTPASLSLTPPAGYVFNYGLFQFTLTHCDNTPVTLTLTYPAAPGTVYWKNGPVAADPSNHWYQLSSAGFSGNTVSISITDGGLGDDDLTVNGTIVDAGGPAILVGNGDMAIPTLSEWGRLLLGLLLIGLVAGHLRQRRS